ncbi:MAG: FHA domain-containing protein, partial [Acidimicrobiia bacterium]|nr:FHA domain-containing protein [Acidimicrobiia bacterium]
MSEGVRTGLAVIEISEGAGEATDVALGSGSTTIGRAPDNDLVLREPSVSRHHARLDVAETGVSVVDLGSANGTSVDGVELEARVPRALAPGEVVAIGPYTVVLRPARADTPRSDTPPPAVPAVPAGEGRTRLRQTMVAGEEIPARVIVATPAGTTEYPLLGDVLVLGRDEAMSNLVVSSDVISRRHAEFRRTDGSWTITDLGSTNGLTCNGQPVTERRLADGDVVWITDSVSLTYRAGGEPPTQEVFRSRVPLDGRSTLTVGRDRGNDVVLDHPMVSAEHARLVRTGTETFSVEDLGSTNGTFVNGDHVEPGTSRALATGDAVRIGPVTLVYSAHALEPVDESMSIELDALHLRRIVGKGVNLLQDISLAVDPNEFVAIVGTSGAGKSTLLDALNGFRPATEGAVLINGADLYRNLDAYRTQLGYVPQDDIVHKELSPYQALDYSARLRLPGDTTPTERRERVLDALDTLGLAARRDVPIQSLSGGQRKRVSIGAELITRPGLFFLDEATSGLDPGTESQMMRLLRRLADQGHTILLVTHATKNVMLCDQVVFLARGGYLAYFGPPDQALTYFGVDDFDEIYLRLDEELSPEEWAARFGQSAPYHAYVEQRLEGRRVDPAAAAGADRAVTPSGVAGLAPGAKVKRVSSVAQFVTLSARNLAILARDRLSVILMLAIAPAIGLLDLTTWKRADFGVHAGHFPNQVSTDLFLGVLVSVLVGALAFMREIVKETEVYRRERMVTLKIVPYVFSKLWVGVLLAIYQSAVFLFTKHLASGWPPGTTGQAEVFVTFFLATLAGVVLGLFISAVATNQNVAPLLLIVFLVPQFMFGGPLLKIGSGGAAKIIGDVTITKWSYGALQHITGVNDQLAAVHRSAPVSQWLVLGGIIVFFLGL